MQLEKLKFTGVAEEGDTIKAFDFQPRPDAGDCYIEGVVLDADFMHRHVRSYCVRVTKVVWEGIEIKDDPELSDVKCVPHEIVLDWDDRVTLVKKGA